METASLLEAPNPILCYRKLLNPVSSWPSFPCVSGWQLSPSLPRSLRKKNTVILHREKVPCFLSGPGNRAWSRMCGENPAHLLTLWNRVHPIWSGSSEDFATKLLTAPCWLRASGTFSKAECSAKVSRVFFFPSVGTVNDVSVTKTPNLQPSSQNIDMETFLN